jgi:HEPN domain-containing protein
VNRTELRQLSAERTKDAQSLLTAGQWSGAYYLAGYSLECALKSCILARIEQTGIVFEDKKFAEKCWTHDIEELAKQAGLTVERDKASKTNLALGKNWQIAKDWSEASRYRQIEQWQAEMLFRALTDNTDGVLPWVMNFW